MTSKHSPDRLISNGKPVMALRDLYKKLQSYEYSFGSSLIDDGKINYEYSEVTGKDVDKLIRVFKSNEEFSWIFLKIAMAEYQEIIPGKVFYVTDLKEPEFNLNSYLSVFIVKLKQPFFIALLRGTKLYIIIHRYHETGSDVNDFIKWCRQKTNLSNFIIKYISSPLQYFHPAFELICVRLWLKSLKYNYDFEKIIELMSNEPMERFSQTMIYTLYIYIHYIYHTRPEIYTLADIEPFLKTEFMECVYGRFEYGCNIGERYLYLNNLFDGARPNSGPQQVKTINGREFRYRSYSIKLVEKLTNKDLTFLFNHTTSDFVEILFMSYLSIKYPEYKCHLINHEDFPETVSFDKNNINVFIWDVLIQDTEGAAMHSTLVFYDPEKSKFTFFDPNGGSNVNEIFFKVFFGLIKRSYPRFNFVFDIYSREDGVQKKESHFSRSTSDENINDPPGYCMYFCFLILEMWMKNHKHNSSYDFEKVETCLIALNESGDIHLTDYIREYFLFITAMVFKVVHFAHKVVGGQADKMQLEDFKNKHVIRVILNGTGSDYVKVARYYRNSEVVFKHNKPATLVKNNKPIAEGLDEYMKWQPNKK